MKKRILSIVTGLITGFLIISAGESFSGTLYPLPEGTDVNNKAQMILALAKMPMQAYLLLLSIYALAAMAVGIVTTLIAESGSTKIKNPTLTTEAISNKTWRPAVICGLVFTLGGVINATSLSHPTWFVIANAFAYVPTAYAGYLMAKKK
ncbi:hypothetical protein CJD36_015200 [Flavipsychrobacter stenotrophus]|uniref:Uncharacterized protein n=1 Tax=Flavipsychrobacter stenotrophus TaxID=2077091 RepID=A0A2S7ST00_9BACT|nr:hypothetical protein [Flavipsychrobacter stenotrophus]PQJ10043.1 hypothetical protein CJD36_015200 [Flavipsychrobacter stenotrophus]